MSDVVDKPGLANLDPKLRELLREQERSGHFVYCAQCSHVISNVGERIEVAGSHQHQFTNPYGYRFLVGCYRQALGCAISGEPTAADTWFPGFLWRYASCEECSQHLGWFFANSDNQTFYGLILPRIQVDD